MFLRMFLLVLGVRALQRFDTLEPIRSYTSSEDQAKAAQSLIFRFIGNRVKDVEVDILLEPGSQEYVNIQTINGKLKLSGTSGVAVAFGFNHYLKYFCKAHVSWAGDQLSRIPNPFPAVSSAGITIKAGVKYRYYQNVCTVSYSSVWWNWTRWEREIDWMALNGINLPLAFTGQEAIWQRVYTKLGFSNDDLDQHFTGPAFLAWGRMGNIRGFGGPLPSSWKKSQLKLQHQILTRMRSLGMIPVLPGFAGHVPSAITRIYPQARVSQLGRWGNFNCTYSCSFLLEPDDPLFETIGGLFIEEQIKEYNGTNHIYNADTFNEMTPRSNNASYLSNTSRAVYEAMIAKDPDAVWLMQGWLFYNAAGFWKEPQIKSFLTAVPKGRMLILDLFSEAYPEFLRTSFYFGQPFIWCMLHNFGGQLGFYGKLDTINQNPAITLTLQNSTMVGTGITPEGINQNYMVYEFMLEQGYTVQPTNITSWIMSYVERRYNSNDRNALMTWQLLGDAVYNYTSFGAADATLIRGRFISRPSVSEDLQSYWYNVSSVTSAWSNFIKSLDVLEDIETVRYDAVDITREMLQLIHRKLFTILVDAFLHKKDLALIDANGVVLLDVLQDLDRILSTDIHFMMSIWIKNARAQGTTEQEKNLYEYNARNQVTLWGPDGNILDYAAKQWSSLVEHYYWPRWAMFVYYLKQASAQGIAFDDAIFAQDVFNNVEKPFTFDRTKFPSHPTENAIDVAKELYLKWRHYLN